MVVDGAVVVVAGATVVVDGAFVVVEQLHGETADRRAAIAGGELAQRDVLVFADQALAALEAAHRCGVVHGGVRPAKLFVSSTGAIRLLGFGHAPTWATIPTSAWP